MKVDIDEQYHILRIVVILLDYYFSSFIFFMKNECAVAIRTLILFSIMTLFMYHSFFVLILANIMKMMPNMRNGQLLRMNDQRGGFGSEVGSLTTPSFIHISEKEIRTNIGSTVTLNCRVQNIRNHTVIIRIIYNYFMRFCMKLL